MKNGAIYSATMKKEGKNTVCIISCLKNPSSGLLTACRPVLVFHVLNFNSEYTEKDSIFFPGIILLI